MANEGDDVRRIRIQIAKWRHSRTSESNRPSTAELQSLVDSELAIPKTWRGRLSEKCLSAQNWIEGKVFRLVFGYERPPLDGEAELHINALHAEGALSRDEQRVCKSLRLPRRADDGILEVVGPPAKTKWLQWLTVAPLAIAVAYAVATFLELFFPVQDLALFGYPIGAAIGKISRTVFYYTWGWKPLAQKLRYTRPMLRARLK